jgi:signal transduction histidine kinase
VSEILHIPVDRELSDRVRWLIALRWMLILLAAFVLVVANRWIVKALPVKALWSVRGAVVGYNLLFWVVANRLVSRAAPYESHAVLMHGQIIADMAALTVGLHYSGGLENPFSTCYLLLVVIGSTLMTKRASYYYAGVATILWIGLLVAEAIGFVPHYNLVGFRLPVRHHEISHILAESAVLATANFGVAYLTSSIIEKLREGEQRLYDANASCEFRARELVRLNERLQELDRTRSLFIRLVTHELRAPVAAIQSYLRLILEGYVPEDRLQEIIAKAEQRARDQLDLIGDLLDLAHLQNLGDARVEPSDAAAALRDVLDMMQARIEDRQLSVSIDVEPDLPLVTASANHIKQVWINLISNAVKYTESGGKVTIALAREGNVIRGSVQDTGIGLAPEEQERIFEEFYRAEAAKTMSRHGTGLGLSIVKGIVRRCGGRVWLESEVGRGSTFFFEIPMAG